MLLAIMCNFSLQWKLKKMITSKSKFTWFEECFMCFYTTWGGTMKRWADMCVQETHGVNDKSARNTYDRMNCVVLKCKHSWPRHPSFDEDKHFRNPVQTSIYGCVRLILWRDTNIDFNFKHSLVHVQRLTYSSNMVRIAPKEGFICNTEDGLGHGICGLQG